MSLDPATYRSHPIHVGERDWTETNCYADFWIEGLHALGLEPLAGLAFTLSTDFEGDQWTMFKFPPEDLRTLYGIEVRELNVWRPLPDHVADQLALGRLVTIDADAWFLPDTAGVTYHQAHQKTTVMAQMVDVEARRLGYFHNAGYFELDGDDFDGLLGAGSYTNPSALPPYVEVIRLDRISDPGEGIRDLAVDLARQHLSRRPSSNPIRRLCSRIESDLPWLAQQELETYHRYAFGICRQLGAGAELAADFAAWLGSCDDAAVAYRTVSTKAKALEFQLARAVVGRRVEVGPTLETTAEAWDAAVAALVERYGA